MARVALIASEWRPNHAGVSVFNQQLAAGLVAAGHHVRCIVPTHDDAELEEARAAGVELVSAALRGARPNDPFELDGGVDVIVGHDRVTGPAAARFRALHQGSRLVHLLHVQPALIDGLKSGASFEEQPKRIEAGRQAIAQADLAVAVGPVLLETWRGLAAGHEIVELVPGLPDLVAPRVRAAPPKILLPGRMEDDVLKGLHLAARAVKGALDAHPDAQLVVLGPPENQRSRIRKALLSVFEAHDRFLIRTFTSDRLRVAEEIAGAAIVLQPSIEEGFGLVTFEAIAAGVPVLTTRRSGAAEVLLRVDAVLARDMIHGPEDPDVWSRAISAILSDEEGAARRVAELRERVAQRYTWAGAARELVEAAMARRPRGVEAAPIAIEKLLSTATRPLREWPRRSPGGVRVPRGEAARVREWITADEPPEVVPADRVLLVTGPPGSGKSGLFASILEEHQGVMLGIKADLLPGAVADQESLRVHLGLDRSASAALAAAADQHGRAVLLIDQMDAVSELVDTTTARLSALMHLVTEASQHPGVRVVVSVRPFELRHDARLRHLAASQTIEVGPLTHEVFAGAFGGELPQRAPGDLLTVHALDLAERVRAMDGASFVFPTSISALRDRFWDLASQPAPLAALDVARHLGSAGALWCAPAALGPELRRGIDLLLGTGLLHSSGGLIGFRHQTLFDVAHARSVLRADPDVLELVRKNQDTFEIRPLLRGVLTYVRPRHPARYVEMSEKIWAAARLHVRLLLADVLTEVNGPTVSDLKMLTRWMRDASVAPRLLAQLAQRLGWHDAIWDLAPGWMADHPLASRGLVLAFLEHRGSRALSLLEQHWARGDARQRRCAVEVLARAERLSVDAVRVLEIVRSDLSDVPFAVPHIGEALGKTDPTTAAKFYADQLALEESIQKQRKKAGSGVRRGEDVGASHGLTTSALDPELLLRAIDQPLRVPAQSWIGLRNALHDTASRTHAAEQLLHRLAKESPRSFRSYADLGTPGSALDYLIMRSFPDDDPDAVAAWLCASPARLALDPEIGGLLSRVAGRVSEAATRALDDSIDGVTLAGGYPTDDADEKRRQARDRVERSRAYRLDLRSRLAQGHRTKARIDFDLGERFQVSPYEPPRYPEASVVRSFMTKEAMLRSDDRALLNAFARTPDGTPWHVGGSRHGSGGSKALAHEYAEFAAADPGRALRLTRELFARGRREAALASLRSLAEHHPEPAAVESLLLEQVGASGTSMGSDHDVVRGFRALALRGALSDLAVERMVARLDSAPQATPSAGDAGDDDGEEAGLPRPILFSLHGGGFSVPTDANEWLDVLSAHLVTTRVPRPELFARAIRAGLRASEDPKVWRAVLWPTHENFGWLGQNEAVALISEIARAALAPENAHEVVDTMSRLRFRAEPAVAREWIALLDERGCGVAAAELALVMVTDESAIHAWAEDALDAWRAGSDPSHATGVASACGVLLANPSRRRRGGETALSWSSRFSDADLALLFAEGTDDETWYPDRTGIALLAGLAGRAAGFARSASMRIVGVLEDFLAEEPLVVLQYVEAIASEALANEKGSGFVLGECLALAFALRREVPAEATRVMDLYEKVLAADNPIADDVLKIIDGRDAMRPPMLRPLTRRKRARARRR